MLSTRRQTQERPTRAEIDPAALDLISRYGPQILGTARRYSLNADDAEDAYQRGLEILLTKAPSTHEDDLVPWLKTVVKHEAFSIRRQRERAAPVAGDDGVLDRESHEHDTGEHAERYEQLRLGAEALGRLKPQEVRCLLLRAEGYSYKQICDLTGWTYTKVNRCLTEGRAAFVQKLHGIQSGAECERLSHHLSALADGEATAEDMAALRPHLRSCLSCRARLREFRAAPRRVAAAVPAAALAGGPDAGAGWLDSLLGWASDRATTLTLKAQGAVEIVSAQKVAAVAASTAVLAGGGVATVRTLEPGAAAQPAHERAVQPAPRAGATRASAPASVPPVPARPQGRRRAEPPATDARSERLEPEASEPRSKALAPEAAEFDPTGNPTGPAPTPPTRQPAPTPQAPAASGGGTGPQPSAEEAEFGL